MITADTTLTEIVATTIKQQYVGTNLEGVLRFLRGPQHGEPTLLRQIASRIHNSPEELFWKDTVTAALRQAPGAMPAVEARAVINLIQGDLRTLAAPGQVVQQTDYIALGKQLAQRAFGACAYAYDADQWYRYEDEKWVPDPGNYRITKLAEEMVEGILQGNPQDRGANAASGRIEYLVQRARTSEDLAIKAAEMDGCAYCLNTPGGYYSAIDGDRDHSSFQNYCANKTRVAPADKWEGGKWDEFLTAILPNEEHRLALQRVGAYVLLGDRQDKAVFFLHGETNRGKSLFLNSIQHALGDYATTVTTDLWLKTNKTDYSLADLVGKRLITCAEFDEDIRINTSLMKRFTGGEDIEARMIRGKPFRFTPQGTIVISTNKMPYLGSDRAAWARTYLMPFTGPEVGDHKFSWEGGYHKPLSEVLRSDEVGAEILRWMMDGAEDYLTEGINFPESSLEVIQQEREDQRHHAEIWIEECLQPRTDGKYTLAKDLYAEYLHWAKFEEHAPEAKILSATPLGKRLRSADYEKNPDHSKGKGWNAEVIKPRINRGQG